MNRSLAAPQRALVIGIDEYDAKYIRDLRGCVADARAIADYLRDRLALSSENIRLLTSPASAPGEQRATRDAILSAIRDFLGQTDPGHEALLYYSGHGSTNPLAPDIAFGEKKVGETLVPADARVNGVPDILDRELRLLVADLVEAGIRLTIIADSCHAGGVTRGDDEEIQLEPVARLAAPIYQPRTLSSLLDGSVEVARLAALYEPGNALAYTSLAGALPTQQSFEIPASVDGQIRWRGAMTGALLELLNQHNGPVSYRDLARALRARIPAHPNRTRQYPHLVGQEDRYLWSDEPLLRSLPVFAVQEVAGQTIVLDGGRVDGLEPGAELTLFTDWSLEASLSRWRVTEAHGRSARAERVEGEERVEAGQPVQLDSLPNRPTVRFRPGTEKLADQWRDAKRTVYLVEVAGEADYEVTWDAGSWVVRRRDGSEVEALRAGNQPRAVTNLVLGLDDMACYERFVAQRPSVDERLPVPVSVGGGSGIVVTASVLGGGQTITVGRSDAEVAVFDDIATVRLAVQNASPQALYINIYRQYPTYFAVERIWPTDGSGELQSDGTVTAEPKSQPGERLRVILIASSEPLEGVRWPCGRVDTARGGRDLVPSEPLTSELQGWDILPIVVGSPL